MADKGEAMTDIGRLRELADKARTSRGPTYNPVGLTQAEFEFTEALHLGADDLLSEIETLRAALKEIQTLGEQGMAPNPREWIAFHEKVAQIARNALAAYDQGKVTNG